MERRRAQHISQHSQIFNLYHPEDNRGSVKAVNGFTNPYCVFAHLPILVGTLPQHVGLSVDHSGNHAMLQLRTSGWNWASGLLHRPLLLIALECFMCYTQWTHAALVLWMTAIAAGAGGCCCRLASHWSFCRLPRTLAHGPQDGGCVAQKPQGDKPQDAKPEGPWDTVGMSNEAF